MPLHLSGAGPPSSGDHAAVSISLSLCHHESTQGKVWMHLIVISLLDSPGTAPQHRASWHGSCSLAEVHTSVPACFHPFHHILCRLITLYFVLKTQEWNMWWGKDYTFTDSFLTCCFFTLPIWFPPHIIYFPSIQSQSLVTPQTSLSWPGEGLRNVSKQKIFCPMCACMYIFTYFTVCSFIFPFTHSC